MTKLCIPYSTECIERYTKNKEKGKFYKNLAFCLGILMCILIGVFFGGPFMTDIKSIISYSFIELSNPRIDCPRVRASKHSFNFKPTIDYISHFQ